MILDHQKVMYLLVGGWNTIFGYCMGLSLYYLLYDYLHLLVILVMTNMLTISMSFFTYKLFVFKTTGNWLIEYVRCYVVYGGIALVGMLLIWIMVDFIEVPFWIAQALIVMVTVVLSYASHKRFTFKKVLIN